VLATLSGCSNSQDTATPADGDGEASEEDADDTDGDAEPEPPPFDWCESDSPPDAACYAAKRDPDSESVALARAIADRYMDVHPAAEMEWIWENAVVMFSFTELYRVTGDVRYRDYYKDWIDHHIEAGYVIGSSDTCAEATMAAILYAELGEEKYLQVVDDAFYYLDEVALRTEQGGINHLGDVSAFGVTLWVDSLFMFGNLLTRWGEWADDADRLGDMGEQFRIFTELLQSEGGFYVHAWGWKGNMDTDIYWGRGNGWVGAAGYDYLRVRLGRGEQDSFVQTALEKLVEAIIASQDPETGMWWTVLNRPGESYLETSAGALFAYGLARGWRYGFLDDSALSTVEKAMEGVRSKIVYDEQNRPVVSGVSIGTSAGVFDHYANRPVADDVAHGVGAVILSLVETSGLPL